MPSLEELIEATGTSDLQPQAQPLNFDHLTNSADIFAFLEKGMKESFVNGNRNDYCHIYASDANRFGISENETFGYLSRYAEKDFPASEIRTAIKSAYQRTGEHGTKQYTPKSQSKPQAPPKAATQPTPEPAKPRKTLIRSVEGCIADAQKQPPIIPLIPGLFNKGEISILAGDTGLGKSLFAMTEAGKIAENYKVLYYDFELSDRQFEKRCGKHQFNKNLLRAVYDPEALDYNFKFSDVIEDVKLTGAQIIIIDNITALSLKNTTDPDAAISVVRGLKELQIKYQISSLVLAHVPKIGQNQPLTINHLAGSKHLSNFADSVFFIGRSNQGADIRYIKQVKNRSEENRQIFTIEVVEREGFLTYDFLGYSKEQDHLTESLPDANDEIKLLVYSLNDEKKSLREIEQVIFFQYNKKISHETIRKWLKCQPRQNS